MPVMGESLDAIWTEPVPVFPIPNCVLLPGAVLPLQVFEPRYRRMMEDLLHCDGPLAMAIALLRDGYEELYFTNQAPLYPVVGVGTILEHEELNDGRYALLLRGRARAVVSVEDASGPYRKAMLVPRESVPVSQKERTSQERMRLRDLLDQAATLDLWPAEATEQIFKLAGTLEALVDLVAFHAVHSDDILLKQRILEEPCVMERSRLVCEYLARMVAMQRYSTWTRPRSDEWPPQDSSN